MPVRRIVPGGGSRFGAGLRVRSAEPARRRLSPPTPLKLTLAVAALVLVAGAALVLFPRPAQAHHEPVWQGKLTVGRWVENQFYTHFGCGQGSLGSCADRLSNQAFTDDIQVRRVKLSQQSGVTTQLEVRLTKALPASFPTGAIVRFDGLDFPLSSATVTGTFIRWSTDISWTEGQTVTTSLKIPVLPTQLELERNAATRTNTSTRHCGSPDLSGVPADKQANYAESDDRGLWHCHGSVYHRHPGWRNAHRSPHNLRPTGDREVKAAPKASTQAERAKGFTSGWHWHNESGYNVYHHHGSGVHPHR